MSHFGGTSWWAVDAVFAPGCVNVSQILEPLPGGPCLCLAQLTASVPGGLLLNLISVLHPSTRRPTLTLPRLVKRHCTVSQGQCWLKDIAGDHLHGGVEGGQACD